MVLKKMEVNIINNQHHISYLKRNRIEDLDCIPVKI